MLNLDQGGKKRVTFSSVLDSTNNDGTVDCVFIYTAHCQAPYITNIALQGTSPSNKCYCVIVLCVIHVKRMV